MFKKHALWLNTRAGAGGTCDEASCDWLIFAFWRNNESWNWKRPKIDYKQYSSHAQQGDIID